MVFRKNVFRALAVVMSFSLLTVPADFVKAAPQEETLAGADVAENQIIVVYEDVDTSKKESEEIQKQTSQALEDMDIEVTEQIMESDEQQGTIVLAEIPEEMDLEDALENVQKEDGVKYVQPNFTYRTLEGGVSVNDPYAGKYQGSGEGDYLEATHVKEAWNGVKTEKQTVVAVLDTGCRLTHEDLKENILADYAYDAYSEKQLTASGTANNGDVSGHGTYVCGLIAAEANNGVGIAGTSYNAGIIPVKVFGESQDDATTESLLKGIEYCKQLIKDGKIANLRVMNMSIGYYGKEDGSKDTEDLALQEAIRLMRNQYNVLTVCSGGNGDGVSTPYTKPIYPSDFEECLSVTALDSQGKDAPWSDYNEAKDISAPGVHLMSTGVDSDSSYNGDLSGTSMAAPVVSGICALLWASNPNLSVDEVVQTLKNTADPISGNDERRDGTGTETGSSGVVNAAKALKELGVDLSGTESSQKVDISEKSRTISVTGLDGSYVYTGSEIKPEVKVAVDGKELRKNVDYSVQYTNNIKTGTARLTITGMGNYSGTVEKTFEISKRNLSDGQCSLALEADCFSYTGKEICPTVTVTVLDNAGSFAKLKQGTDFTVAYADNIEIGTASVSVDGIGDCEGTLTGEFRIAEASLEIAEETDEEKLESESSGKKINVLGAKNEQDTENQKSVRTGDETNFMLWIGVAVLAALVIVVTVFFRGRKRK